MNIIIRLWRLPRCLWLRYKIYSGEEWIAECAENGIFDSVSLRVAQADLDVMRLELSLLEGKQP